MMEKLPATAQPEPSPDPTAARPLAIHPLQAKTILNRMRPIRKNGVPAPRMAEWSINPYRGCQHACAYCYARRTHIAFDLNGGEDFEREIFVKRDAGEILRAELRSHRRSSWNSSIVIGTAVDPYQPIEGSQRVTRAILEALRDAHAPVQIITKNSMVVRDADILAEIARHNHCAVFISITTLDADLARRMEPATPPPLKRLAAVKRLVELGVPAGVMLAPVLPWITDGPGTLEALALAAYHHQAQWISSGTLRLHPDVRPVFLRWLAGEFPALVPRYETWYRWTEPPEIYRTRLHERVAAIRSALGMPGGPPEREPGPTQLALF
jgi:DNA repair photolyase